jgi:hypothetical protein
VCRTLYDDDGRFEVGHMNNWQHAMMFAAFMLSGCVDLIGLRLELPSGTEQVGPSV